MGKDEPKPLPPTVLLGAMRYRVQETAEKELIFTEDQPIYGCASTMTFWRHDDNGCPGIWSASIGGRGQIGDDIIDPGHFCQAFGLVQKWRGRNFKPWGPDSG